MIGAAYFLCVVYGRLAVFVLLFLQFGQLAAIFVSASLLLRSAYVVCVNAVRGLRSPPVRSAIIRNFLDPPMLVILPVGMDLRRAANASTGEDGITIRHSRAPGHIAPARVNTVLYGPDARWILAMHVGEAAVASTLLHASGGRSVAPYYPPGHNVTGSGGPAEVELVVVPGDIVWHIVWPYCAGLATLALLVAVDNWDTIYSATFGASSETVFIRMPRKAREEGAPKEEQVQSEAGLGVEQHDRTCSMVVSRQLFDVSEV